MSTKYALPWTWGTVMVVEDGIAPPAVVVTDCEAMLQLELEVLKQRVYIVLAT